MKKNTLYEEKQKSDVIFNKITIILQFYALEHELEVAKKQILRVSEACLRPCQTSVMELFCKNS